jgi:dolichyl-phosphate beta-glucosyltransferase
VPAFNEKLRLPRTLEAIRAHLDARGLGAGRVELVLVDDGSHDGTADLVAEAARADARVVPTYLDGNRGKGAAVRAGVGRTRGHAVVCFDADLSYPLTAIDEARTRLDAGADIVAGARDLVPGDARRSYSLARRAATGAFAALVEAALHLGVPDTQCGFKAYRGAVARALFGALTVDGFAFDVEMLYLARHWGLAVERMPIEMVHAPGGSVRLVGHGLEMARETWAIRSRGRRGVYPPRPPGL